MRWQDLKNKPFLRQKLERRAQITRAIRQFFGQNDFLEVETPLLVACPNLETHLEPLPTLITDEKGEQFSAFLITSPEFSLKKLLAAGFSKIFQISKVFRDGEPWNEGHNPEFTLLEWYEAGIDYKKMMERTEQLVLHILKMLNVPQIFKYQNQEMDLTLPWLRLSMREAWRKYADLDLEANLSRERMLSLAQMTGCSVSDKDDFDDLFFKIFLTKIEPRFPKNRPLFLYDYPAAMAAFSRLKEDDPRYAERFELYIGGWEMANAYGELIDFSEQEKRFQKTRSRRKQNGKIVYNIDNDFLAALKSGLPECSGAALGVDRLVMFLTDASSIEEVMLFAASELFDKPIS